MRLTVCTRQRYDDDHTFRRRMELARKTCIPAVLEASRGLDLETDLGWRWRAHARHATEIEKVLRAEGWLHRIEVVDDFGPDDDDIQATLDSDDKIEPTYLRMVAGYWRPGRQELRSWQPIKERFSDGRLHRHRYRYKAKGRVSPFYAVYNPDEKLHAYIVSHGQLHELIRPIWRHEPGAIAVIHGDNALMDLKAGDIRISKRSAEDYR